MRLDEDGEARASGAPGVPAHMGPYHALIIGASFGGPPAVEEILSAIPRKFPVPVVVCQHITVGFTAGWAERLDKRCALRVKEAHRIEPFEPGNVYIAPAGFHARFFKTDAGAELRMTRDFADSLHVPSIDKLMTSAADVFGSHTLAALLTGLGSDGASGMLAIRQAGGYTLAESAETALSDSMPAAATAAGGVVETLPLSALAARLVKLGLGSVS